MKISRVIEILTEIQAAFGDISITGGAMVDDVPLSKISVTEMNGMEIWPRNPNGLDREKARLQIDGVFLE